MTTAHTAVRAQHATLSTTTADSITFTGSGNTIAFTNHHASEKLYVRFDGTTAVAEADETYVVLPGNTKSFRVNGSPKASVVGSGNVYSVELW